MNTTTPDDGITPRQRLVSRITKTVLASLVVLVWAVACIGPMFSGGSDGPREASAFEIRGACEDVVTERLRSPSTADFNSTATSNGNRTWTVTGTVDAENAFGGTVRETYECSVRVTDEETFTRLISFG